MQSYLKVAVFSVLLLSTGAENLLADIIVGEKKTPNVVFSGSASCEYGKSKNITLLNNLIDPDAYNYQKLTFDLRSTCKSGSDNNDCISVDATLRMKAYLGNATNSFRTGDESISLAKGNLMAPHSHESSRPIIWMKSLFIEGKVNQVLGLSAVDKNSLNDKTLIPVINIKFGMFPYEIGRGISLGDAYGTPKSYLSIYNKSGDFAAPGLLLTLKLGDAYSEFYFSKLESKSASPGQTMANKRAKVLGNEKTPWAGSGMDEDLYSAVLGYEFKKDKGFVLPGKVYAYGLVYNAPGTTAELPYDSDSCIGTIGAGCDFSGEAFEFGFEGAFNLGQENRLSIDRNAVTAVKDDNGNMALSYSHILDVTGIAPDPLTGIVSSSGLSNAKPAYATALLDAELKTGSHLTNNDLFNVGTAPQKSYQTKSDRIRPAYTNYYRGYMFVADAAYKFVPKDKNYKLKLATSFGIASGDRDPSKPEVDKDYRGFLAFGERYEGKRVPSYMVLCDNTVKKPLTLNSGDKAVKISTDETFTDIVFAGVGSVFYPMLGSSYKPEWSVNALTFYKDSDSFKVSSVDPRSGEAIFSTELASKHLGIELNTNLEFWLAGSLKVDAYFGMFIPGDYYSDIKGIRLSSDLTKTFDKDDFANTSTEAYTLSNNVSYMFSIEFAYKF